MKKVSIIIPVYNEEECIPLFYDEVTSIIEPLAEQYDFQILFTNNCSTDSSLSLLKKLREQDSRVDYLTFSRNFGYQCSLAGGINHATGDAIIIIDVDGEDPPDLIPQFIQKWEEGFDVVYGIRGKRPEPKYVTALRDLFYKILKKVADNDINLNMAEYSLFSAKVKKQIINNNNTFPFLRAEIAYSGFKKHGIHYDRRARLAGTSHYNFIRMFHFAIAGILSVSTFLLRIPMYLWPLILIGNFLSVFYLLYSSYYTLLIAIVVFDLAYLIGLLSVIALYIARIYKNGIARPMYIIDWQNSSIKV